MIRTAFLITLLCAFVQANPQSNSFPVKLVAKNAALHKAGTGYAFTEGCSTAPDGRVFFTDQPNDKIFCWNENDSIIVFKEGCERSNGTLFDGHGNLVCCADLHNRLISYNQAGVVTEVYARGYNGMYLNGPNDLWIDEKGGIYFTDPYYHRPYWEQGHKQLQDVQAVYYLRPNGEIIRIIDDLGQPNGIVGTPDNRYLFVADIKERKTWKYTIGPDGTLSNKTLFAAEGSDGMTVDSNGNVYLTYNKVHIYNRKGVKTGEIGLPEGPSNVCFGGADRKTLFITARTSVYTLKMKVKGVE
ncbi:MAG: SMP-30/gluconolactonase/LRE family protein [Bacteroidales bacterium]